LYFRNELAIFREKIEWGVDSARNAVTISLAAGETDARWGDEISQAGRDAAGNRST
jgi:hypothetical protein